MPYISRLLLVMITLLVSESAFAQDSEGEPPTPDPAAETAAPSPDPEMQRRQQLRGLASMLSAEYLEVGKADNQAEVLVQRARSNGDLGIVLLVPGDGLLPTTSPGIAQLRNSLTDHGWTTWLLGLERPPLISTLHMTDAPSEAVPPADAAVDEQAAPAPDAPPYKDIATRQAEAWQAWREAAASRVLISATEARSANSGKLVIVAENRAIMATLLALNTEPALADGVIFLHAMDASGEAEKWPENYGAAVLEIITPGLARVSGKTLRDAANAATLSFYEQAGLEYPDWPLDSGTSALARKVRGWLKRLVDSSTGG